VAAILASPRMNATDRTKYWKRWRDTSAGKYNWLRENDEKTVPATAGAAGFDVAGESRRAARRATIALDLVRLAGEPPGSLNQDLDSIRSSVDLNSWDKLGPQLVPLLAPTASSNRISRV